MYYTWCLWVSTHTWCLRVSTHLLYVVFVSQCLCIICGVCESVFMYYLWCLWVSVHVLYIVFVSQCSCTIHGVCVPSVYEESKLGTHRHRLSTMQAVDCCLRFCMAGKLHKGTACEEGKIGERKDRQRRARERWGENRGREAERGETSGSWPGI